MVEKIVSYGMQGMYLFSAKKGNLFFFWFESARRSVCRVQAEESHELNNPFSSS